MINIKKTNNKINNAKNKVLLASVAAVAAIVPFIGTQSASADTVDNTATYEVKSGDTLWSIALAHNLDLNKFEAANNKSETNTLIYAGDILKLSENGQAVATVQEPVAQATTNTTVAQPATTQATSQADTTASTNTQTTTQEVAQPAQTTTTQTSTTNSDALNALIARESGGNVNATNGQYYGLGQLSPQARAIYGGNSTDYNDQLNAMKSYISARYGTAENALAHSNATGWY